MSLLKKSSGIIAITTLVLMVATTIFGTTNDAEAQRQRSNGNFNQQGQTTQGDQTSTVGDQTALLANIGAIQAQVGVVANLQCVLGACVSTGN